MNQFDISTNRIPHGLLTPEERKQLEDAAKVPGAVIEYFEEVENKWRNTGGPVWSRWTVYRVHLPAPEKREPPTPKRIEMPLQGDHLGLKVCELVAAVNELRGAE